MALNVGNMTIRKGLNRISMTLFGKWCAYAPIPVDGRILFRRRDRTNFYFLSNFYPAPFVLDGQEWPHVEMYYQSRKSTNPAYRAELARKRHASWSKYVGDSRIGDTEIARKSWFRRYPDDQREDWDEIKEESMRVGLWTKFSQNKQLGDALDRTRQTLLVEDSTGDSFWGCGSDGLGVNMLGMMLMDLRTDRDRR